MRSARAKTVRPAALGLTVLLALAAPAARAHDETVSVSEVRISDRLLVWRVDAGVAGLGKVIELPVPNPELTERHVAELKGAFADYLRRGLTVELDGRIVEAEVGALEPLYETYAPSGEPYISNVKLELRYAAERPIEQVRARVAFFSDLTSQHRSVITVRWDDRVRQYVRLGVAELELARGQASAGRLELLREFLVWGAEHIFIGLDHIAFLLALLLVARGWGELVKVVTAFTVAHSITLLLAALDVLRIPSRITEVLIAASIVYVAAENLWLRRVEHRFWLTFAFGLVHGLGFATELRERLAELGGSLVLPVVSFNLGVELGQVVIVSLAFPLLLLLRRRLGDARRIARFGSVPILLLGLFWLVERLVGD